MNTKVSSLKEKYKKSKTAKINTECICPSCNSVFIKKFYQQVFCSTKPGTTCKDNYWNNITPNKRNNKTRISPASANWLAQNFNFHSDNKSEFFDDDPGWDSHKDSF